MNLATLLAAAAVACPAFPGTGAAAQLVTVQAPPGATVATLSAWRPSGGCWRRVLGPWAARLGRAGLSAHKREGDGSTPVGTFRFGPTVYGIDPDPGVREHYHRLVCGDWWDEDPASPAYNSFRHVPCGVRPRFGGASEALWRIAPQYRYFAVIEYNAAPVVPGRGSAIFLHVAFGATAGCVSLPEAELVRLLRWLRPEPAPLVRISLVR